MKNKLIKILKKLLRLDYITIIMLLIAMLVFLVNNNNGKVSIESLNETKSYMLNVSPRSKRIHIDDCDSAKRMSEKNKLIVENSIINLINEGYIVCGNCNAGLPKKGMFKTIYDKYLHSNLFYDDIEDLPSKKDYLSAIDKVCDWYVNHIPTYQHYLEEEKLNDYKGSDKYINEYKLNQYVNKKLTTNKVYSFVSANANGERIDKFTNWK